MSRYIILIIGLVFFGCSKEVKNNKALDGKWAPVDFSLFDYNGLKTKPPCSGTVQFTSDGKKSTTGTYDINLLFDYNGSPHNFIEKGTYRIENTNKIQLSSETAEQTQVTLVYSTKEDLILDVPNKNYFGYYIVLKK